MGSDGKKALILFLAELFLFMLLISAGITGSSFGWLKSYPGVCDIMELEGERKLAGVYRGIRSDEFLHHGTPAALAQYHAPGEKFPVLNSSIGITPRNLMVYHDTGIPVWHIATLARPAVWGFFLMDLRRALAFYWFFPLFFALWGVHFLLNTLFPDQKFLNGFFSLCLVLSPVCAAWSFWPAGNMAGLCWAAGFFLRLFRTQGWYRRTLFSFLALWCALCSVMTLYIPRIYPVFCLLAVVVFAYLYEEKLYGKFKECSLVIPLSLAVLLGGVFCIYFLWDCREAIAILMNTEYPGKRRLNGGSMGVWSLVQGYLAPLTVYKIDYANQCELTGPLPLIFPMLPLLYKFCKEQRRHLLFCGLCFFILWTYFYQIAGFPSILAMASGWNRCNPQRCDLALALAQILLLGLLFSRMKSWNIQNPFRWILGSGGICVLLLWMAPEAFWRGLNNVYPLWYIILILCGIAGWTFAVFYGLLKRTPYFIGVFCAGSILPGLIFNPVCVAPCKVKNKLAEPGSGIRKNDSILFLGEKNFCAVAAWASGNKVFNGFFLYPDPAMRKKLFENDPGAFNTISNYDMIADHETGHENNSPVLRRTYPVEGTGSDHIRFLLPCRNFDYSFFGVQIVAALHEERDCLQKNPSLILFKSGKDLDFYRVRGSASGNGKAEGLFQKESGHQ